MSFKKLIHLVFLLNVLLLSSNLVFGQSFKGKISSSLSGGNLRELSKSFDKRVQVTIDGKSNYYSNSQAEIVIRNHLGHLGERNFTLIKSGTASDGGAEFYIGEINCTKGSVKVYIYARKVTDGYSIQEIRFEKK